MSWIIFGLCIINAGYMAFDGARALFIGDYIRPTSGAYKGQLGPWIHIVRAIGIDPESSLMKSIFLVWGLAGLIIAAGFITGSEWGWTAMLVFNIACLWNLIFGSLSSLIQIVLLLIVR